MLRRLVALIMGAVMLAAAAVAGTSSAAASETTPYRFHFIGPLSGPAGVYGTQFIQGLKAAALVLNRGGGIQGHPVEISQADDQGNAALGITLLTKAFNGSNKPNAVAPGILAPELLALTPIVMKHGALALVDAPVVQLNDTKKYPYAFMYSPPWEPQENAIAKFSKSKGWTRVAILYNNDPIGQSNMEFMKRAAKANGITVVAAESYENDAIDVTPVFEKIKAAKPQAIWETDQGQSPIVFKGRHNSGLFVPMISDLAAGSQAPDLVPKADLKNAWGMNYPIALTPPAKRSARQKEFVAALKSVGNAKQFAIPAHAYDWLMSIAAAAKQAKSIDTAAVARELERLPANAIWAWGFRIHFSPKSHFVWQPGDPSPTRLYKLENGFYNP